MAATAAHVKNWRETHANDSASKKVNLRAHLVEEDAAFMAFHDNSCKLNIGVAVDGSVVSAKAMEMGCWIWQGKRQDKFSILHVTRSDLPANLNAEFLESTYTSEALKHHVDHAEFRSITKYPDQTTCEALLQLSESTGTKLLVVGSFGRKGEKVVPRETEHPIRLASAREEDDLLTPLSTSAPTRRTSLIETYSRESAMRRSRDLAMRERRASAGSDGLRPGMCYVPRHHLDPLVTGDVLGSVSDHSLRESMTHIAVVKSSSFPLTAGKPADWLFVTDGSHASLQALVVMARQFFRKGDNLCVMSFTEGDGKPAADALMEECSEYLSGLGINAKCRTGVYMQGTKVSDAIVGEASRMQVDFLVMGVSGAGKQKLGSVSENVCFRARCTTIIIKDPYRVGMDAQTTMEMQELILNDGDKRRLRVEEMMNK